MNHQQRVAHLIPIILVATSCESCRQREASHIVHDTFVCESCKEADR